MAHRSATVAPLEPSRWATGPVSGTVSQSIRWPAWRPSGARSTATSRLATARLPASGTTLAPAADKLIAFCPAKEPPSPMSPHSQAGNDGGCSARSAATGTRARPKDAHPAPRCTDNSIDPYIEALIASAPPLTYEQRDILALLLRKHPGKGTARPAPNQQPATSSVPPAA